MRKLFIAFCAIAFALFLGSNASAAPVYTIPASDLFKSDFIDQGISTTTSETGRTLNTPWVNYAFSSSGSLAQAQVGDSFDWDNTGFNNNAGFGIASMPLASDGLGDLSGFTHYSLLFRNPSAIQPLHVNIYFNTGDTDAGNTDRFYQQGWTWLNPGATALLTIDFSSADTYIGGASQGFTAVLNKNEVSNIGFQVALPGPGPGYDFAAGSGNFNVEVAAPIPPAVLLLASGLLGLVGIKRRFKK
jgi:hypothetical protein